MCMCIFAKQKLLSKDRHSAGPASIIQPNRKSKARPNRMDYFGAYCLNSLFIPLHKISKQGVYFPLYEEVPMVDTDTGIGGAGLLTMEKWQQLCPISVPPDPALKSLSTLLRKFAHHS